MVRGLQAGVEGDGVAEEGVDDVGVVVQLLVHHQGEDAHLGSTAVVELDGELLVDGLLVPSGGGELSLLDFVLSGGEASLDEGNGQEGAEDGLGGQLGQGGKAGLHLGQVVAGGEGGGESVARGGDQVTENGQLGDAAVLGLDGAEALELGLIGVLEEAKGIPETQGGCEKKGKEAYESALQIV